MIRALARLVERLHRTVTGGWGGGLELIRPGVYVGRPYLCRCGCRCARISTEQYRVWQRTGTVPCRCGQTMQPAYQDVEVPR